MLYDLMLIVIILLLFRHLQWTIVLSISIVPKCLCKQIPVTTGATDDIKYDVCTGCNLVYLSVFEFHLDEFFFLIANESTCFCNNHCVCIGRLTRKIIKLKVLCTVVA